MFNLQDCGGGIVMFNNKKTIGEVHLKYTNEKIDSLHGFVIDQVGKEEIQWDKFCTRLDEIKALASKCPESIRIQAKEEEQNGKLQRLIIEVAGTKARVTIISSIFIALMTAVLIKLFKYM